MFYHIVLFTKKNDAIPTEVEGALDELRTLLGSTDHVKQWEVSKILESRPSNYHYLQFTVFTDRTELENYRNLPKHEAIKQKLRKVFDYQVVDYEAPQH